MLCKFKHGKNELTYHTLDLDLGEISCILSNRYDQSSRWHLLATLADISTIEKQRNLESKGELIITMFVSLNRNTKGDPRSLEQRNSKEQKHIYIHICLLCVFSLL